MTNNDKRQRIIAAAYQVMAEKGYEKASIKDIANAANITPGLVHYYFKNKEEILSELLMEASEQYTHEMDNLKNALSKEQLAKAALKAPVEKVERQPEWYKLRFELFAMGLRDSPITPGVNRLLENGKQGIADILHRVLGESIPDPESTAAVLLACFDGLGLQKLLNPEFDLVGAFKVLEQMILSLGNDPNPSK